MTIVQQGDVKLFQTNDGGEITVDGGITEMSGCFVTAAYLSLFGGNEDDDGISKNANNWWGNLDENDPALQYRSETQNLLQSLPATTGNLQHIEDAANRDLVWFIDKKIASSIIVQVTMPAINTIDVFISIVANGVESNFTFTENWKACLNESNQIVASDIGIVSEDILLTYALFIASLFPVAWYRLGEANSTLPMIDEIAGLDGDYINPVTLGVSGLIYNDPNTALQPSSGGYGLVGGGSYNGAVLNDAPISYWRLGESSGLDPVIDQIGLQDGSYINGVIPGQVGLILDSDTAVLMVSATETRVSIASNVSYNFTNGVNDLPFTLEAWVDVTDLITQRPIISKARDPIVVDNEWLFQIQTDGSLICVLYSGTTGGNHNWITNPGVITVGVGFYVAATYDGSINSGKIYVNGASVPVFYSTSGYTNMTPTLAPVNIGARFYVNGSLKRFFNGIEDEVAIYDYELLPAQLLNHYNLGSTVPTSNTLTLSPPFTINTWVNFTTSDNTILVQNNLREGYSIETDNGFIKVYANTTLLITSTIQINDGSNHYVALALDTVVGGSADSGLWLDTALDVAVFLDTNNPNTALFIGGESTTKTYPGVIDEVAFFDKILTAAEHTQANSLGATPP